MENPQLKNLNSISDDELDSFSGGYILDCGEDAGERRYYLIRDSNGNALAYSSDLEEIERQIDRSNACAPEGFVLATKGVITREQYREIYGRMPRY